MSSHPREGSGCGPIVVILAVLMALMWLWGYWTGRGPQPDPLGHIVSETLKGER